MPRFFFSDLSGLAVGLLLGVPVILAPGFAFGWWFDLLHFRSKPIEEKWPLAATFGIIFLPILIYFPFRFLSLTWVWLELSLLAAAGLAASIAMPRPRFRLSRAFATVALTWIVLATALLLDIHIGNRLYPSSAIIDTSVRAQVVASLAHSHTLPPESFFSNAGPLHYHYLLFLIPAVFEKLSGGFVTSRMALAAVTIWAGIALITTVGLFIRWAIPSTQRRTLAAAWALLLIGGFDCIPFLAEVIRRAHANITPALPLPDVEWWNGRGQVFSWLDTAIWHPHHIVALCACLIGCLLLFESRNLKPVPRTTSLVFAAFAVATGVSSSVLVGSVFLLYLAIVLVELLMHSPRHAIAVLAFGVLLALLCTPVFREWRMPAGEPAAVSFSIGIRPFEPVTRSLASLHVESGWIWQLTYLISLPLNYLLELGVFFVGAVWWLYNRFKNGYQDRLREHLLIGLFVLSLVLVSLVQAGTVAANDFGYRAILPAQFVMLLWTAELFETLRRRTHRIAPNPKRVLQVVVFSTALGAVTTALGIFVMRHSIGFGNPGVDMYHAALRRQHSAERLFDLRSGYSWIRQNTPRGATIQETPLSWQPLAAQYGERRTVIYSWFEGSNLLGTRTSDTPEFDLILKLFQAGATPVIRGQVCGNTHIDYLVVQDSDSVWYDHRSYVWSDRPVFAAPRTRIFRCGT